MEMEGWAWITVAVMFGGLVICFQQYICKHRCLQQSEDRTKWPPGPRTLPVIGDLHQLSSGEDLLHVKLAKLAKEHGGLMTVWFGSWAPTIVISDHEVVWEALVNKGSDFSSRSLPKAVSNYLTAGWKTLATSHWGAHWDKLHRGLHSSGLNPNTILEQTRLQEEDMSNLLSALEREACSNSGVVKPLQHLRQITIKLIGRLCFGVEFNGDDIFLDGMDNAIHENIRLSSHTGLINLFDFVRYIPGLNGALKEAAQQKQRIHELLRPYIESLKFSCPTHCYLHFFLSQNLSEDIIIANLFELFVLAVDSTSATVAWALAFLIHDQNIQKKLYQEVSQREITAKADKVREFIYLKAVVKETMRIKPIAPLAIPHKASKDSKLMATRIKEGSTVLVNLYALLHDPNIWIKPHRFMPERFLASPGSTSDMERSFLPFGVGRRSCAGMEVGKLQVAFALASLVSKFHWSSVAEGQPPDLTEDLSFILSMKAPLLARITPRLS